MSCVVLLLLYLILSCRFQLKSLFTIDPKQRDLDLYGKEYRADSPPGTHIILAHKAGKNATFPGNVFKNYVKNMIFFYKFSKIFVRKRQKYPSE